MCNLHWLKNNRTCIISHLMNTLKIYLSFKLITTTRPFFDTKFIQKYVMILPHNVILQNTIHVHGN